MLKGRTFRILVMIRELIGVFLVLVSIFLLCVSQLLFIPIVVFATLFVYYIVKERNLRLEDYLFFVFLFFATLSIFVAREKSYALGGVLILVIYYFFFYVGKNWNFDFKLLTIVLGGALVVLSVFGIFFYIFPDISVYIKLGDANLIEIPSAKSFSVNGVIRSSSITPNPVIFSSAVVYIIPIVLAGLLKEFSERRWLLFFSFSVIVVLGFSVILVSSSRSFLVLFPFVILTMLILSRRYDLLMIFSFLTVILLVVFWGFLKDAVLERVRMIFEYKDFTSFFNRLDSYNAGIRLFKDNFLLGVGLINFKFYVPKYFGNYIHNLYLSILVEVGILGFLSFLSVLLVSLYKSFKKIFSNFDIVRIGFVLSVFIFLIHGLIDNTLYVVSLGSLFWLFLGISLNEKYSGGVSTSN